MVGGRDGRICYGGDGEGDGDEVAVVKTLSVFHWSFVRLVKSTSWCLNIRELKFSTVRFGLSPATIRVAVATATQRPPHHPTRNARTLRVPHVRRSTPPLAHLCVSLLFIRLAPFTMRHGMTHRTLSRNTAHRMAMLRNLTASLFEHEVIETTVARAKELRRYADKIITLGKSASPAAWRRAGGLLPTPEARVKLFGAIAARFADRSGGYTRVLRTRNRRGDNAPLAVIELVGSAKSILTAEQVRVRAERKALAAARRRVQGELGRGLGGLAMVQAPAAQGVMQREMTAVEGREGGTREDEQP